MTYEKFLRESFRISLGSQLTLESKDNYTIVFINNYIFELAKKDFEGCYEVANILQQLQVGKEWDEIPAI